MCLKEIKRLRFFNSASFRPNPKQVFSPHGFDFSNSGQIPIEIEKVTIGKIRLELSCNPFHPWKRSKEERSYSDLIFTTDFTISSLGWGKSTPARYYSPRRSCIAPLCRRWTNISAKTEVHRWETAFLASLFRQRETRNWMDIRTYTSHPCTVID